MRRSLLCLSFLVGLNAMPVWGATFHVSPQGSDSTSCGSVSTPCRTINGGLARMSGGDTLIIGDGTYDEQISTVGGAPGYHTVAVPNGSAGAHTTIRAATPGRVRLRMSSADTDRDHLIFLDGAHNIRLEGLVLDAEQQRHGVTGCLSVGNGARNHQYINLECLGADSGISGNGHNMEVRGGHYHGMGYPGCWSSSEPPLPGYCHGIYLQADGTGGSWVIDGVTFSGNSGYGVHSYVTDVVVRNSTFTDNFMGGVIIVGRGGAVSANCFEGNRTEAIMCNGCTQTSNRIEQGACPRATSSPRTLEPGPTTPVTLPPARTPARVLPPAPRPAPRPAPVPAEPEPSPRLAPLPLEPPRTAGLWQRRPPCRYARRPTMCTP